MHVMYINTYHMPNVYLLNDLYVILMYAIINAQKKVDVKAS